jgi:hypothetical protein
MLRIGSDRDAPEGEKSARYVRELRIWDRVRSPKEIGRMRSAVSLGRRADCRALALYWGLAELVAGRNAGLIGDASLGARHRAKRPSPGARPFVNHAAAFRVRKPTWDAVIPLTDSLSGSTARSAADAGAAKVRRTPSWAGLEPDGNIRCAHSVRVRCLARASSREGITLWISRDGRPRTAPRRRICRCT